MGIVRDNLRGLIYAAVHDGVDYTNTLTIGRLGVYDDVKSLKKILKKYNPEKEFNSEILFAEEIFSFLGAAAVDSIDYSDYEGANIIHDLNLPVKEELKNKYSCVVDGGTLEHIFNFPTAIKNCMDMVKLNGHLIMHTPGNNCFGHGFYQFSPELFFSLLVEQNGFSDTKIYMQDDKKLWFLVMPPDVLKRRVDVCCSEKSEGMMFIVSKKSGSIPHNLNVQQIDYIWRWDKKSTQDILPPPHR